MNKTILITGINGFLGTHAYSYYSERGFEVYGIDHNGSDKKNTIVNEVTYDCINSFNIKFDYILHFAGSGTVKEAHINPDKEKANTVSSTKSILEYMVKQNRNSKLIFSSSAAVYGNSYTRLISEEDYKEPISIYGEHKILCENLCNEYATKYNLNISIIRYFSVYGEGIRKQLLWDFCNTVKTNFNNLVINCFGTGKEKRDFIHVKDAILLSALIFEKNEGFNIYNGGTGIETKVEDIMRKICFNLNYKGKLNFTSKQSSEDPQSITANISKIKNLGFTSTISIKEGIHRYVEWFKRSN